MMSLSVSESDTGSNTLLSMKSTIEIMPKYCKGFLTNPLNSDSLVQSQENFRNFLSTSDPSTQYCSILCSILEESNSLVDLEGLMGFFLPRNINAKNSIVKDMIIPTSFYYSVHNGKNNFMVQSYSCVKNKNIQLQYNKSCSDCKINWRSFRNNTAIKYLRVTNHNKLIKCSEKKYDILSTEFQKHKEIMKIKWGAVDQKFNKLSKRVSYWKKKFKTLKEAVSQWRKIEEKREGFITIEEDDAIIWKKFYEFIDLKIDREHYANEEMRDLHKELIRTETMTLGKFNTRNDKRGIRTTKISSRILNYSMSLANSMGKVRYENEATLRSLPTWDTVSR